MSPVSSIGFLNSFNPGGGLPGGGFPVNGGTFFPNSSAGAFAQGVGGGFQAMPSGFGNAGISQTPFNQTIPNGFNSTGFSQMPFNQSIPTNMGNTGFPFSSTQPINFNQNTIQLPSSFGVQSPFTGQLPGQVPGFSGQQQQQLPGFSGQFPTQQQQFPGQFPTQGTPNSIGNNNIFGSNNTVGNTVNIFNLLSGNTSPLAQQGQMPQGPQSPPFGAASSGAPPPFQRAPLPPSMGMPQQAQPPAAPRNFDQGFQGVGMMRMMMQMMKSLIDKIGTQKDSGSATSTASTTSTTPALNDTASTTGVGY